MSCCPILILNALNFLFNHPSTLARTLSLLGYSVMFVNTITKDSVKVLAREDGWVKRKVREAIKIKIGQQAMNRDQGYELPPYTTNVCCHVFILKAVT